MEPLLVSVTAISLLLATGLALVAWKLLGDTRSRSAARAEMLASLADAEDVPHHAAPTMAAAVDTDDEDDVASVVDDDDAPLDDAHYAREVAEEAGYDVFRAAPIGRVDAQPAARVAPIATLDVSMETARRPVPAKPIAASPADLLFRHIRSDEDDDTSLLDGPAASPMFQATSRSGSTRWIGLAAAAAIIVLGTASVLAFKPASHMLAALTHDANDPAHPAAPLELLSLRNGNDSGDFTVTGLVQNPAGAPVLKNVVAVVYLFDREGRYFASGKAPIESGSLQPGEESPFVVKIQASAGVSRYRVGFRTTDGAVIAHVDHRGDTPAGATGVDVGPGQPSAGVTPFAHREITHGH